MILVLNKEGYRKEYVDGCVEKAVSKRRDLREWVEQRKSTYAYRWYKRSFSNNSWNPLILKRRKVIKANRIFLKEIVKLQRSCFLGLWRRLWRTEDCRKEAWWRIKEKLYFPWSKGKQRRYEWVRCVWSIVRTKSRVPIHTSIFCWMKTKVSIYFSWFVTYPWTIYSRV